MNIEILINRVLEGCDIKSLIENSDIGDRGNPGTDNDHIKERKSNPDKEFHWYVSKGDNIEDNGSFISAIKAMILRHRVSKSEYKRFSRYVHNVADNAMDRLDIIGYGDEVKFPGIKNEY